jgi:hypothetical protein
LGLVSRSAVGLRFVDDELDPQMISAALGAAPTLAYAKGQQWTTPAGLPMIGRTGVWSLNSAERAPADLDRQIEELLAPLSNDLGVWRDLSATHRGELFVGLFMTTFNGQPAEDFFNEGLEIAPRTLETVAARGLAIAFDIYAGADGAAQREG